MGGLEFCKHCSRKRDCWFCEKLEDWVREHADIAGELISREAAVKTLKEKACSYVVSMFATSSDCNLAREIATECANEVQNMDAVDAEPVRHGKWIERGDDDMDEGFFACSVCRDERCFSEEVYKSEQAARFAHYCPNCGAKMDNEKLR